MGKDVEQGGPGPYGSGEQGVPGGGSGTVDKETGTIHYTDHSPGQHHSWDEKGGKSQTSTPRSTIRKTRGNRRQVNTGKGAQVACCLRPMGGSLFAVQVLGQLVSRVMQVPFIHDVVAAEHAGGLVAAYHHGHLLRDASAYQVAHPGPAQVME